MNLAMENSSYAKAGSQAAILQTIQKPDVSVTVWKRQLTTLMSGLSRLDLSDIGDVRCSAQLGNLPSVLGAALNDAGFPAGIIYNELLNDMLGLANRFAVIMHVDHVEVRLEVVTTNACKKFHGDYVTARLISTYVGQGTQWLDQDAIADNNHGDPHSIEQLATSEVAIFKGRLSASDAPAIHRSPPIAGTGETRLVLVINPIHAE